MASWNTIKEVVRALKGQMSKNERNAAKYQKQKERGPVKAFFHITKNENVPAIEQQGLLTNHPNANINSASHPFRKHGTDAGGVWVTTEPTAFPVYGTTIGGKNGNAEARADALSTIKIEVPLPELAKMKAVQDPYGKNILRKGNDPRAVERFGTWAGIDVPTTVLLDDVKPQWLKNVGYLEEFSPAYKAMEPSLKTFSKDGSWELPSHDMQRMLNKADFRDLSGFTGHRHGWGSLEKSPQRFVEDYLNRNQPISERLPRFPVAPHPNRLGRLQGAKIGDDVTNASKRFGSQPLAFDWTNEYRDYVKPGESSQDRRSYTFTPGAISRGIGGQLPPIKERHFDWNTFNTNIANGESPFLASLDARPKYRLDWDNIINGGGDYHPDVLPPPKMSVGHITAGPDWGHVGTGEGSPWTLYDIYKIRHAPSLTATDRMNYRDDLIRRIYDDGVATGIIDDINPNAKWREIIQAMMKIQTSTK